MSEKDNQLSVTSLDGKTKDIAQQILDTDDVDKVKDLTALFNLNIQKRNVMRVVKMNELLDNVTDKVAERFEKTPDNFTNDDLLKYMQATENSIEKANKNLNLVEETPAIQLQQNNQVNINIGTSLDREGRAKVTDAVQAILKRIKQPDNVVTVEDDKEKIDE